MKRPTIAGAWVVAALLITALDGCSCTRSGGLPTDGGPDARSDSFVADGNAIRDADRDSSAGLSEPVLLSPLSTSRVTRRAPTVRFRAPDGADGCEIELCADRACATVLTTGHVPLPASSWQPDPLPAGIVFWRARGTRGSEIRSSGPWSQTWYFRVPTRDTAVDSSYAGWADVDGDGLADLVRTTVFHGGPDESVAGSLVHVHRGRRGEAPPDAPDQTITLPGQPLLSTFVVDFDGSGTSDVVGLRWDGTSDPTIWRAELVVLRSAATGRLEAPTVTQLPEEVFNPRYPRALGDVTSDGVSEILLPHWRRSSAGPSAIDEAEGVFRFDVAAEPRLVEVSHRLVAADDAAYPRDGSVGDRDGDGRWDDARAHDDRIGLFRLQSDGAAIDVEWAAPSALPGWYVSPWLDLADVDADGLSDVVFGALTSEAHEGAIFVVPGSREPWSTATLGEPLRDADAPTRFGATVAGVGDVNGDGYDDVATGDGQRLSTEAPWIYWGSPSGLTADARAPLGTSVPFPGLCSPAFQHADFDGDGREDVLVSLLEGDPRVPSSTCVIELYLASESLTAPARAWRTEQVGSPIVLASY